MDKSCLLAGILLLLAILGQSTASCGKRSRDSYASSKIAGGSSSQVGEWPWQAMIYSNRPNLNIYIFCGGTILSENWVMTAAQCFETSDVISVYVGKMYSDRLQIENGQQMSLVAVKYQHPQYIDSAYGYDVGLLRLSTRIIFTDNIQPVCLPPGTNYNVPAGTRCYVSGWGHMSSSSSDLSSSLRDADLKVQKESYCSKIYPSSYPRTLMCALESGTSICDGDGGGPLVCEKDNGWYQYGIASRTIDQCGTGPDFFTEVTEVYSWIQDITGLSFPPPEDGALSNHHCGNFVWILTLVAMISFNLH